MLALVFMFLDLSDGLSSTIETLSSRALKFKKIIKKT